MPNIKRLQVNLEKNGFKTSLFSTSVEASDYLYSEISERSVGFGGSMTLESMGLYERLSEKNKVVWHWKNDDKTAALKTATGTDIYLSSANAVAESGEIVNIDGTGNRIAAMLYGHEKVYVVIGTNKIEETLEKAIERAQNVAAPLNARRFHLDTPCATGEEMRCYNCSHAQRICKGMTIMSRKLNGIGEFEIIIIDEALGY